MTEATAMAVENAGPEASKMPKSIRDGATKEASVTEATGGTQATRLQQATKPPTGNPHRSPDVASQAAVRHRDDGDHEDNDDGDGDGPIQGHYQGQDHGQLAVSYLIGNNWSGANDKNGVKGYKKVRVEEYKKGGVNGYRKDGVDTKVDQHSATVETPVDKKYDYQGARSDLPSAKIDQEGVKIDQLVAENYQPATRSGQPVTERQMVTKNYEKVTRSDKKVTRSDNKVTRNDVTVDKNDKAVTKKDIPINGDDDKVTENDIPDQSSGQTNSLTTKAGRQPAANIGPPPVTAKPQAVDLSGGKKDLYILGEEKKLNDTLNRIISSINGLYQLG